MKKSLFLLGLGAMALASCSQEEVIQVNPNQGNDGAITFQARTGKAARADELTTDNLTEFAVFAFKGDGDELQEGQHLTDWFGGSVVFKQYAPTEEEPYVTYKSDKKYYFPTDGSYLSFLAYAPTSVSVEATDQYELKFNDFTVSDNIEEQVDLIAARTIGTVYDLTSPDATGIGFYFEHMLSKVYVSSALNSNEDYNYTVAGIKLGNVAKSGNCIFNKFDQSEYMDENGEYIAEVPEAHWEASETLGDIVYIFDEPVEIGDSHTTLMSGGIVDESVDKKGAFLVIPQEVAHSAIGEESGTVEGGTAEENVTTLEFKEGVAYVALLIRITNKAGDVIYPYAKGTDEVSKTVNDVKYAWAAFPIASTWQAGFFTDYFVDFTNGAGFIPGEAKGYWISLDPDDPDSQDLFVETAYQPVLGTEIKFMEVEVGRWYDGNENTLEHSDNTSHTYEAVVNASGVEDPFGE